MKILIIDDQFLFREEITQSITSQSDMTVAGEGASGREAVELARKLRPDLILMDFSLPDGASLEAACAILSEQPNTKIVFLTDPEDDPGQGAPHPEESDENLFAAVRLGAKGLLAKNIPAARLLAALRGVERGEAAISREMTARLMDEFTRAYQPPARVGTPFAELTTREMQVLRELATDATNHEIANRLFISENTVRNHIHNILEKLGVSGRRAVGNLARQHGVS